ncbi:hypothetical protein NYE54_14335 [Paenibacillus sp. FSL K6-1330]|uniref:hypothetical protein n=1 Tax=Paenibacillus sp. FSL K6-1330 TaxID=2975292 RepID=UPI0030DB24E9
MEQYDVIRISETFPTEDIIARWIIGLAIIHNDFIYLKKKFFMQSDDISVLVTEAPSNFKYLAASLREAIFYIEESERTPDIKNYIESLPSHITELYSKLTPLFRTGIKADLLQRLTNIRNVTFHFSKPHRSEIIEALKGIQDQVMFFEDSNERFLYAEHIRNSIMLHSLFELDEINSGEYQFLISELIRDIKDGFNIFVEFSREVNKNYLKSFL